MTRKLHKRITMRRPKVDLNVSEGDFTPSSPSPDAAPVHNFMPMTPFMLPHHQPTQEVIFKIYLVLLKSRLFIIYFLMYINEQDEEEAHSLVLMLKQRQLVQSFWDQQKSGIENATAGSFSFDVAIVNYPILNL